MHYFPDAKRYARLDDARQAAKIGQHVRTMYEGSRAFARGESPVRCPYVLDTPPHAAWLSGWLMALDRGNV